MVLKRQPEDWDDREYIPDPEDEKPEVMARFFSPFHLFAATFALTPLSYSIVLTFIRVMMTFQRKFQTLMPRRSKKRTQYRPTAN